MTNHDKNIKLNFEKLETSNITTNLQSVQLQNVPITYHDTILLPYEIKRISPEKKKIIIQETGQQNG